MKSMTKLMVVAMLLVAALVVAPVAADRVITQKGDTVYVGEENLNFSATTFGSDRVQQLVHYSDPTAGAIDKTIQTDSVGNVSELTKTAIGTVTGPYYLFNTTVTDPSDRTKAAGYVNIQYPEVSLDVVLNNSQKDSVAGKSVTRDNLLDFKLTDNILIPTATIKIEVTLPGGGTTTKFGEQDLKTLPLTGATQYIGAVNLSSADAGTYTAIAKWPDTSDFYGKGFDSNTVTFEVSTKKLAITSNKDSVVRGNSFSVTVTGESKQKYWLYIKTVSALNETEYPFIVAGQNGVSTITGDLIAHRNVTVETTAGGTRTVQFNTNSTTDDRQFTIRVEHPTDSTNYDEVKVKVEEGAVTITAAGTGTYYIGEEITLEGTCTESDYVYLFLTGPNLPSNGVALTGTMAAVVNDNANSFTEEVVEADDTWSYKWNTADIQRSLDAGGYTIYAVSAPKDKSHLSEAQYDTISIQLRSGFISATSSGAVVAKGDDLKLTGIAQGDPDSVHVWIFGKNLQLTGESATVEDDGSFEYELKGAVTKDLSAGQYFVVIQHPMMNGRFDIYPGIAGWINGTPGSGFEAVRIAGLQASDAANALIKALDSPNIDDTYVKLTFVVEEAQIFINPIGDVPAGSTFTISGTTNLAVGDTLNVEVTSAAFTPTSKGEASGFASVARTTEVKAGDGVNTWSVEIDGSAFKPDQYIVKVECIETDTTATANFNVVEAVPTTQPPVSPTATVTTTTTATTTTEATPTESPGFGALLALAGLGAVAYLVLRRD